ncbi:minor tail protein [Gordonia phage Jojo24]|uniref:Minor tail protein n=1 Tax=Gordonia phage Jojo24 TaxID=2859476 RepID=A0AAE7SQB7_9CAUD|nr:minor tail protein [Gordonia phage Jojo24]QXO13124.1 minor tail protein [Gordonia phage Jojo24]
MSTPILDWANGDVILDVNVGSVSTVDVPIPAGVEVLVVQGKDGTGVNLQGAVAAYGDLPTDLGPLDAGHAYLVQGNGKLYVWSGTAWPTEENGADFRGQTGNPGRGITGVTVLGNKLRFAMSDNTIDEATVPAIQQAIDSAAAASGSATAANTARLAAEAAASTAGTAASTATTERTSAQTARTGAQAARTAAETARDAASGFATTAQTAAGDAEDSATAAAASAAEAADVVASGVPNATDTTKGGVVLAGDLGGTWDAPTVPGLANKADLVGGKVPVSQIPAQALVERRVVASTAARLALTDVQEGDVAIQTGNPGRGTYILGDGAPSDPDSWSMFVVPDSPVSSVNGYTGIVILGKGDVGLDRVDNTNDLEKPISTAAQTALDGKVAKSSTINSAYGTDNTGADRTWLIASGATGGAIALRGTGGTVTVGAATAANHAPTKQQLDDGLGGKSNTGHTHAAGDIASGTLDIARLPVGTGSTQVAAGNDSRITGAVPNTRTVSAGTGLSGGGALDANRTLSVQYGTTAGTAAQGNDARLADTRTPTDNTVSTAKIQDGAVTLAKLATAVSVSIQQMIDASVLAAQLVTINAQTGAYTLLATDANKAVEVTSAAAVNVTIPTNASVAFPIGTVIEVDQMGAGKVTIVGASGVTVQSAVATPTTRAQYSALVLRKRAADLWLVTGDLA